MTLNKKRIPATLTRPLVGMVYSLIIAIKSFIRLIEPFAKGSSDAVFDLDLVFMFCWPVLMCISFIALLKRKMWGAYLLLVTTIFWAGSATLLHDLSLTYFLVGSTLGIGICLWILAPILRQLD